MEQLIEYLDEEANILIIAPRRIGKTSLMREASRRLSNRFLCLQVDLQKAHTAADAVVELSIAAKPHRSLWGKVAGVFSSIFGQVTEKIEAIELDEVKISLRSSLNSGNWQAKGGLYI